MRWRHAGVAFVCSFAATVVVAADATINAGTLSILTDDYFQVLQPRGDCYAPYHQVGSPPRVNRDWEAVTLENDYIRVVVLPELGGRIYKFINKTTGNNQFYDNPEGIKRNPWGRMGWWMATGGIEFMGPWDEHGGAFYTRYNNHPSPSPGKMYLMEDLPDGVKLTMVFSEQGTFSLTRWKTVIETFVPDDRAWFALTTTVTNESASTQPLMFWANAMISPGSGNMRHVVGSQHNLNQQIVFDQNVSQLFNHNDNAGELFWGNAWDTVQWPVHTGRWHGGNMRAIDISLVKNWYDFGLQYAGLFTKAGEQSTYFGQYSLQDNEGILKVFPAQIAPGITTGVKYWHWGSYSGAASGAFADGQTTYAELMTGPVRVFQEPTQCTLNPHPTGEQYYINRPAGSTLSWTDYYLTPRGIGTMVKGTRDVVLNLQVPATGEVGNPFPLKLGVYTTMPTNNARVTVDINGAVIYEETALDVGPATSPAPYYRETSPNAVGSAGPAVVTLTFRYGDQSLSVSRPTQLEIPPAPALLMVQ